MPNKLAEAKQNMLRKKILRMSKRESAIKEKNQKVLDNLPIPGPRFDKFIESRQFRRDNKKLERLDKRATRAVNKYDKIEQRLNPEYGEEMKQFEEPKGSRKMNFEKIPSQSSRKKMESELQKNRYRI